MIIVWAVIAVVLSYCILTLGEGENRQSMVTIAAAGGDGRKSGGHSFGP